MNSLSLVPVLTRLGYRESRTDPEPVRKKYASRLEKIVAETRVRVFYREAGLSIEGATVRVHEHVFTSRMIAERFARADRVLLLGASAVREDFERIHALQAEGNLEEAVLHDAVLSEKVDYGLDFLEQELITEYRRQGGRLGPRLSCGYGDFVLENQRFFYQALDFAHYGIRINEQFILDPEKTVTALAPLFFGDR